MEKDSRQSLAFFFQLVQEKREGIELVLTNFDIMKL